MSRLKPSWWEWTDKNRTLDEPIRLRDDAPEEIKEEFEKDRKEEEEERAQGIWK
jgi:hypothetical protein